MATQTVIAKTTFPVNRSGTITTGGAAQSFAGANPGRIGHSIQNNSTGDLWFNDLGNAAALAQPSTKIPSGSLYESPITGCPGGAISIIGATTGQAFSAREW